jgi:hypothetical protein
MPPGYDTPAAAQQPQQSQQQPPQQQQPGSGGYPAQSPSAPPPPQQSGGYPSQAPGGQQSGGYPPQQGRQAPPPPPGGGNSGGFDPTFDAAHREAPAPSLGYRSAAAPPPPGSSQDLPPGYMSRYEKSQVRRKKKNIGRVKIAIGALILLVCVAATIALTQKSNQPTTLADVKEGECFTGELDDVTVVDCGQPHQRELYALVDPTNAEGAYPGEDVLLTDQGNICSVEFVTFFGATVEVAQTNGIDIFPVVPTEAQWDAGEKQARCLTGRSDNSAFSGTIEGQGAAAGG